MCSRATRTVRYVRANGFVLLSFLIDVFLLSERRFAMLSSMTSGAGDVSRAGCGSKLLIG